MISRNFLKSSLIYSVFGALPLASSIILLPFYTNLLSTNDFGLLAIFISFTLLIQVIINYSFDGMVGIHYYELKDSPEQLKKYISTVYLTLIGIGALFILLSVFIFPSLFNWIFDGKIDFFPYGIMSVATAMFNSFFKTYTLLLINQQRPIRFMWMNLFNFVLTLLISIVGLYLYPLTLVGPMYGRLFSGVGIFLLSFYFFQSESGFHFNFKLLKGAWSFCTPIVIYFLMFWVIGYIDRFIINHFSEPSLVGIYDFGVKCTLLIDFVIRGMISAIYPKIFSIWKEKNNTESTPEINKYFHSLSALSLLMIAATILFFPLIVPLVVTNQNYYQSFQYLPLLSVSFITSSMLFMYIAPAYYFKKTFMLPKVFLITAIVQVVVSFFFVKYFGLWGAAWSLLVVKPVQLFLMYWESEKVFHFTFNKIKMIFLPLAYSVLVIVLNYFTTNLNYYIVNSIGFATACLLIFFVYRTEIFSSIDFFKKKYL